MRNSIFGLFFSLALVSGCASSPAKPAAAAAMPLPQTLEEAVQSGFRNPAHMARDRYRHPIETLKFFGIEPNMTVVEIWPASGWYAEILAPYLASKGKYIGAVNSGNNEENQTGNSKLTAWLNSHPELAANSQLVNFDPASTQDIVPAGTADMVLTFRNVHNWLHNKTAQAAFEAYFKALKPGGILGVVEHRAGRKSKADSGYVREREVIRMARKAGFKLVEKSEINANPKDTKNYKNGVWTLPPSNRHDKADDAKYVAIGESDRMTLKFIKP